MSWDTEYVWVCGKYYKNSNLSCERSLRIKLNVTGLKADELRFLKSVYSASVFTAGRWTFLKFFSSSGVLVWSCLQALQGPGSQRSDYLLLSVCFSLLLFIGFSHDSGSLSSSHSVKWHGLILNLQSSALLLYSGSKQRLIFMKLHHMVSR